jgi:hypothetical protein
VVSWFLAGFSAFPLFFSLFPLSEDVTISRFISFLSRQSFQAENRLFELGVFQILAPWAMALPVRSISEYMQSKFGLFIGSVDFDTSRSIIIMGVGV